MSNTADRILVVGPAWVGDVVMSQSLYMTLRWTNRNVRIDILAPPWSQPILEHMPEVHRIICIPVGHGQLGFSKSREPAKSLWRERYDQAIILPRSLKSALIPFLARIPRRTGYRGEMRYGLISDMRKLDEAVLTQTVQRYVALGLEPDDTLPPSRIPQPRLLVDETNRNRLINKRVDKDAAQKACCASHPHR